MLETGSSPGPSVLQTQNTDQVLHIAVVSIMLLVEWTRLLVDTRTAGRGRERSFISITGPLSQYKEQRLFHSK